MPYTLLNGVRTYYQVDGEGAHLFLLFNGAGCTTETWGELAEGLAKMGRVIRFDARGDGRTQLSPQEYTLETLAVDADSLLTNLGIQKAVCIGHAFGGRVSQIFTRDYPGKVRALILCGTGGYFPPRLIDRNFATRTREETFLAQYCGSQFLQKQPEKARRLLNEMLSNPASREAGEQRRRAREATPVESYWGKIPSNIPVLLLYGTEDRFGTSANAYDLARRIVGSKLVFIEGAGHMAIREEPERLLKEVEIFLGLQKV